MNQEKKFLKSQLSYHSAQIKNLKEELEELEEKIEKVEEEKDIQESRIAFYDLLIKEQIEKFGAEGEAIFREMFPDEADEILRS